MVICDLDRVSGSQLNVLVVLNYNYNLKDNL